MPSLPRALRAALLSSTVIGAAAGAVLAAAPSAAATDGAVFSFPRLGVVEVNGTVDDDVNFTVYRILDPNCTGTSFPGPDNSCVPQEATDTVVIPKGTYAGKRFRLDDVPSCGATQQDVYAGAYQPTVTVTGTHDYLAGGIVQLGECAASSPSPSPSPSGSQSSPRSTPSPSTSAPTTPVPSTPSQATGSTVDSDFDATQNAVAVHPAAPTLASTGTDHTGLLLVAGVAAVGAGAAALVVGRRTPHGH